MNNKSLNGLFAGLIVLLMTLLSYYINCFGNNYVIIWAIKIDDIKEIKLPQQSNIFALGYCSQWITYVIICINMYFVHFPMHSFIQLPYVLT